jgi:hypothetical protein
VISMVVRLLSLAALAVVVALTASAGRAGAPRPPGLQTAIFPPLELTEEASAAFVHARAAGATAIRLPLDWSLVAPENRPDSFDEGSPDDPAYRWSRVDNLIKLAASFGLEPIVCIYGAPTWASEPQRPGLGPLKPSTADFGLFGRAAALRYSGGDGDLPRVRYWQAWNEPNLQYFLMPQYAGGVPASGAVYRGLLNAFALAVHGVHVDNVVITGGLVPFRDHDNPSATVSPLRFMRDVLCMSSGAKPHPTCSAKARFDVWATHPYTAGGPFHSAYLPDDVSLGDLPEMNTLLRAAVRAHHVLSAQPVRFWVTEFSWDTNPPDPGGVPLGLHARWVAEALYQMWRSGVTLATWFGLHDEGLGKNMPFQSGLWFRGADGGYGQPKPALEAFRFPLVAYLRGAKVFVWGRTPRAVAGKVTIQLKPNGPFAWRRLATLHTSNGVFTASIPVVAAPSDTIRAVFGRESSRGFSLTVPHDQVYQPFGSH